MAVRLTFAAETTSFLNGGNGCCLAGAAGFVAGESIDLFAAAAAGALAAGADGQARSGGVAEMEAAADTAGSFTEGAAGFDWSGRSRRRTLASTDLTSCMRLLYPLAARNDRPGQG